MTGLPPVRVHARRRFKPGTAPAEQAAEALSATANDLMHRVDTARAALTRALAELRQAEKHARHLGEVLDPAGEEHLRTLRSTVTRLHRDFGEQQAALERARAQTRPAS